MKKLMMFASIRLTVFCLFWLTVLTFWGTVYQVDHGIYEAQHRFFDSYIFFVGILPLPGAMLVMTLLFINLLFSFFVHYQAGWRMPGLMLIHIGLMMMLLGGFFTKLTGIEATVSLFEGEGRNAAVSRTEWEISYSNELHAVQAYQAVDLSDLRKGREFSFRDSELTFKVLENYEHAKGLQAVELEETLEVTPSNSAGFVALEELDRLKTPEEHTPGVRLQVEGAKGIQEIVLTPRDQRPLGLELEDGSGRFIMLRRKRYELPLFMVLNDFSRSYYPGTETPEDYRSLITVHLGEDIERDVIIKMNEPFRINGWTFFQQSFAVTDNSEMSVFAVTRNFGRLVPYWATGITSVGLAMHFLQMQWMQLKRRRKKA
ncbi:cytochrome c biogenesis protein ResB [Kiritimatiellota bacterium B12222]|nr:cytochrome c biogenesis protein ResB [Kiritimatiellota bacterium B12222]